MSLGIIATICTVSGPEAVLASFAARHIRTAAAGAEFFDFETVIPLPQELATRVMTLEESLTWQNSSRYRVRERTDGKFVFVFETVLEFPESIFRQLAEMYVELTFKVVVRDEHHSFRCVARGEFNGRNDFGWLTPKGLPPTVDPLDLVELIDLANAAAGPPHRD